MVKTSPLNVSRTKALLIHMPRREYSVRSTRRRQRRPDPLASVPAVEAVLDALRSALPDLIPLRHKDLVSLLNSVRGMYAR
jgi:hypothetical protein